MYHADRHKPILLTFGIISIFVVLLISGLGSVSAGGSGINILYALGKLSVYFEKSTITITDSMNKYIRAKITIHQ